jgi:hypothetical protein
MLEKLNETLIYTTNRPSTLRYEQRPILKSISNVLNNRAIWDSKGSQPIKNIPFTREFARKFDFQLSFSPERNRYRSYQEV